MAARYSRDQELLDRFPKKADYKKFLNKKIKEFTPEEKRFYNRIAQQEKRNPFGQELDSGSSFITSGVNPFADIPAVAPPPDLREVAAQIRSSLTAPPPIVRATPPPLVRATPPSRSIPTVADMRSLLRSAGALDRTPPQQHFTPLVLATPDYISNPELLPKDGKPIIEARNRRRERIAADEAARLKTNEALSQFNIDLRVNKEEGLRSALVDALGIIGDKKRSEVGERELASMIAGGSTRAEALEAIEEGEIEFDRPARVENTRRRDDFNTIMEGDVGTLKTALDRFNIPSDYLLKPTRKESRKAALSKGQPDWYKEGLQVPKSPRELRLDLQYGLDEDDFDPDPVASPLGSDDSFDLSEYIREDVREATAREKVKRGELVDNRQARRDGTFVPSVLREGTSAETAIDFTEDGTAAENTVFDGAFASDQLEKLLQQAFDSGGEAQQNLQLDLPSPAEQLDPSGRQGRQSSSGSELSLTSSRASTAPSDLSLSRQSSGIGDWADVDDNEPPVLRLGRPPQGESFANNPWKDGSREAIRFADRVLSEDGRFPPTLFSAERGRDQFGFDPKPQNLLTGTSSGISDFGLGGSDEGTFQPDAPDFGDDLYAPISSGRSMLKKRNSKEDEIRESPLLPEDFREVIDLTGMTPKIIREPNRRVPSWARQPQTLENTVSAGSVNAGEKIKPKKADKSGKLGVDSDGNKRRFAPSGGRRRKKKP